CEAARDARAAQAEVRARYDARPAPHGDEWGGDRRVEHLARPRMGTLHMRALPRQRREPSRQPPHARTRRAERKRKAASHLRTLNPSARPKPLAAGTTFPGRGW